MQRQFRIKSYNLLTLKCWLLVCLFLSLSSAIFAQSDTANASKADIDSLSVDSLQLASDFKSKVVYNAFDSIVYDLDGEKVYMYGKAHITYEDIDLKADYIELNFNNRNLFACGTKDSSGNPVGYPIFKQNNDEFKSDSIRYNFDTKRGRITEITTQQGDSYIHGSTVKKESDNTTYIKHGYYTTCEAEQPHYYIASSKIKVIPDKKIVTGPAELVIGDVPTPFAVPFGFFPNKKARTSGILIPAYGQSVQLGVFLTNGGYYFGLSDYFDLALTGDVYSRGSYRLNAFSNYNNRYHYSGNLSLNYSFTKVSQKELPDYRTEKGFFIRWNHTQDSKARPNTSFSASVNAGSSSFYKFNLSNSNNFLTNTFASSVAYSKSWVGKPISLSVGMSHSQNTTTNDISVSLPSATFGIGRISPFKKKAQVGSMKWFEKIGVSYTTNFQNSINTKDTLLFRDESLKQLRYGIQHIIPISTSFTFLKYFNVSPSIAYSEKWYLKTIEKSYNSDTKSVIADTISGFKSAREFSFAANLNTRIFGLVQFKKGKVAAIRHVITPSIGYSWRPDFSDPSYGMYKSVQLDSTGRTGQYSIFEGALYGGPASGKSSLLTFNLDNNLEMKTRTKTDSSDVIKKLKIFESLAASMNYNFALDSMNLSPIGVSGRTTLLDKITFNFAGVFDPYVVNEAGTRINQFELTENGNIAHLNNANLSLNFSIVNNKKSYSSDKGSKEDLQSINKNTADYIDYTVPFNLYLGYSLFYQNNFTIADQTTQTLNFSGDIQVTKAWKVNFNSGYDFIQKDLSYTSLGIYRDLHCWEMRLNWVPFGFQQNYYFQINVKSSVLQDLKLTKRNDRFDQR
jgi:lipopolysaccharide assembly outer membrane protein LptD (OstA)